MICRACHAPDAAVNVDIAIVGYGQAQVGAGRRRFGGVGRAEHCPGGPLEVEDEQVGCAGLGRGGVDRILLFQ